MESYIIHQGLAPWVTGWMMTPAKVIANTLEEAGVSSLVSGECKVLEEHAGNLENIFKK